MIGDMFKTGIQLTQMVGLGCLLLGVLVVFGGLIGGRGPFDLIKGAALMALGVFVAGLGKGL